MKRALDIFLVVILAPFVMPVMIILSLVVYLDVGSPVLFRQRRVGLGGCEFTIFKFRTMHPGDYENDALRVTYIGRFLRRLGLDELPNIINILRGEMSIVGPRPLLAEYLSYYSFKQLQRHDVRPGITGLAQVRARHSKNWKAKFAYDLFYVKHNSFGLDSKIIWWTFWVIARDLIQKPQHHVSVPKFTASHLAGKRKL